MYYNTTNEKGDSLKSNKEKAKTQEELIEALFKASPKRHMSPSIVHKLSGINCPLTSIRRAMSNLTDARVLIKTPIKVSGPYGRPEYTWKLFSSALIF